MKAEDAIVILDCPNYFVATLNMSKHIKKSDNKEEWEEQKEKLKKGFVLDILNLS